MVVPAQIPRRVDSTVLAC